MSIVPVAFGFVAFVAIFLALEFGTALLEVWFGADVDEPTIEREDLGKDEKDS